MTTENVYQKGNDRLPVIHIGLPKTATKTTQWRLFARHSEVFYLGRFAGAFHQGKYSRFDECRNQTIQKIMHEVAYTKFRNPDFSACAKLLDEALFSAREANQVPVWSWESHSTDILENRYLRARNLLRLFGKAKILITIRHPVKLLESAYFLQLRRDNIGARAGYWVAPYYRDIDKWLEENYYGEVLPYIDYAETIRKYVDLFGKDNVHVSLFEDLVLDKDKYFSAICEAMDINVSEGLKLVSVNDDNARWNQCQVDLLKTIKKSVFQSLRFGLSNKSKRKRILGLDELGHPAVREQKATAAISPEGMKRILAYTEQGNRWLEQNLGLPLEEAGYFDPLI